MGLIAKELGRAVIVGTAVGATSDTIVANATLKDTIITKITMHNTDSSARTVTLMRVLNSAGAVGTSAVADKFWSQAIPAGDTVILGSEDISCPLTGTNDTLQAYASTTLVVNIFVDGWTQPDQT
jgi:hypothetical protein